MQPDNLRHHYFWCPECPTELESRTESSEPPDSPLCPHCGTQTENWDEIAAFDETFRNKGGHENANRWRAKRAAAAAG